MKHQISVVTAWIIGISLSCLNPSGLAIGRTHLEVPAALATNNLPFLKHTGPGPFDNALALNVQYEPIIELRKAIETALSKKLVFFTGWDPKGEAHVTVITPPEFAQVLGKVMTMDQIHQIATANNIQSADLTILGIGSGKKEIAGKQEETFFLIVESQKLRLIRLQIWQEFVRKGGLPQDWDPTWFFPHITIGYTKQDLHEPDVLKNVKHAFDNRFLLKTK